MKTYKEAIAIAQQWEDEKSTGPAALVGRALLAHINSLASPQVTDEQIDKAETGPRRDVLPDWPGETVADRLDAIAGECEEGSQRQSDLYAAAIIWRKRAETRMAALEEAIEAVTTLFEADETPYLPDITRAIRVLLSAPPAAETRTCGTFGEVGTGPSLDSADVSEMLKAAPQEAKPVAAAVALLQKVSDLQKETYGHGIDLHIGMICLSEEIRTFLAAATQQPAPADKDAIRNAALAFIDCANEHRDAYYPTADLETRFDRTRAALQKAIALQSQPQQVTK